MGDECSAVGTCRKLTLHLALENKVFSAEVHGQESDFRLNVEKFQTKSDALK